MSCRDLAERYAKQTNSAIPVNKSRAEQATWLIQRQWTCTKPNSAEIEPNPDNCPPVATNNLLLRAKKNVWNETGFLAWVNEGAMKCIHQVTGTFYGRMDNKNLVTGKGEMADQTIPAFSGTTLGGTPVKQTYFCNVACRSVTAKPDDPCLDCVTDVLTNFNHEQRAVQLCPGLTSRLQPGETLQEYMQDCLTCQNCIAQQVAKIDTTSMTPNEISAARQDAAWNCVLGNASYNPNPFQWTPILIIGIVLAGLLVAGLIIAIVWISKDLKQNKNIKNKNIINNKTQNIYQDVHNDDLMFQ